MRIPPHVAVIAALAISGAASAQRPKLFEFHSAFWVNMHHLLYEQARAQLGLDTSRAIVRAAAADTDGIQHLAPDDRRAWDAALASYETHLARHDVLERDMAAIKATLGDQENAATLDRAKMPHSLRLVLERAAPAFRAVWWPRFDTENRRWIASMQPLVAEHRAIADTLSRIFASPWDDFLIRVDASAYANWAGAYTTNYPDRITMATREPNDWSTSGLETIFHESLHTMDDSLRRALQAAADRQGKRLPPDLSHAIIFFTAGEVIRGAVRDYQPYAERLGIWKRGGFPQYLPKGNPY